MNLTLSATSFPLSAGRLPRPPRVHVDLLTGRWSMLSGHWSADVAERYRRGNAHGQQPTVDSFSQPPAADPVGTCAWTATHLGLAVDSSEDDSGGESSRPESLRAAVDLVL